MITRILIIAVLLAFSVNANSGTCLASIKGVGISDKGILRMKASLTLGESWVTPQNFGPSQYYDICDMTKAHSSIVNSQNSNIKEEVCMVWYDVLSDALQTNNNALINYPVTCDIAQSETKTYGNAYIPGYIMVVKN